MKIILKIFFWFAVTVFLLGFYFADNIKGYYLFKKACTEEAGLKIYQPLKRDVGWFSEKNETAYLLYFYPGIAFVRFTDEAQSLRDLVRTVEKNDSSDSGFRQRPVDESKQPLYKFQKTIEEIPKKNRITRFKTTVTDLQSGQISVAYQEFSYRIFSPDWGVNQSTTCSSFRHPDVSLQSTQSLEMALQQAFLKKSN